MPLCGFNEKMLEGLAAFNEGLFEHGIVERAKAKQWSIDKVVRRELFDMERFLAQVSRIEDQRVRKIVQGLTLYAQGVYESLQGKDPSEYRDTTDDIRQLLYGMDKKFYAALEGEPDDMRALVDHLNMQQL